MVAFYLHTHFMHGYASAQQMTARAHQLLNRENNLLTMAGYTVSSGNIIKIGTHTNINVMLLVALLSSGIKKQNHFVQVVGRWYNFDGDVHFFWGDPPVVMVAMRGEKYIIALRWVVVDRHFGRVWLLRVESLTVDLKCMGCFYYYVLVCTCTGCTVTKSFTSAC